MSGTPCPHCRNVIDDPDALFCHFCGNSLHRTSDGLLGRMRGAGGKWIWITLAVIIALIMIAQLL